LWRFSRRELANVLSLSDSDEFAGTILMLKLFENKFDDRMNKLADSMQYIQQRLDGQLMFKCKRIEPIEATNAVCGRLFVSLKSSTLIINDL